MEIIAKCVPKDLDESFTATCRNKRNECEFEVITAVMIQSHVVWDLTPYLLVNIYRPSEDISASFFRVYVNSVSSFWIA